jgi:hypothetical protein
MSVSFRALLCTLFLGLVLLANLLPTDGLSALFGTPQGIPAGVRPLFVDRFFVWDSAWYDGIARSGYSWNPAGPGPYNVAFFPLWPLILRGLYAVLGHGAVGRGAVIALAALVACASICCLHRLASRLLPPRDAHLATAFYALNPAAHFMLQSYPVGVANLLAILALTDMQARRFWRAAFWAGVATATGPLMVFLSFAVVLAALADGGWVGILRRAPRGVGLSLLSLSGILAFMAFLWWRFGDPTPFVAAQDAWMLRLPLGERLVAFCAMMLVVPDVVQAAFATRAALQLHVAGQGLGFQTGIEQAVGHAGIFFATLGAWASLKLRPRALGIFAILLVAAYIWLDIGNLGVHAALRLTYAAIPASLGLALLLRHRPILAVGLLLLSAITLLLQTVLTKAGYFVF